MSQTDTNLTIPLRVLRALESRDVSDHKSCNKKLLLWAQSLLLMLMANRAVCHVHAIQATLERCFGGGYLIHSSLSPPYPYLGRKSSLNYLSTGYGNTKKKTGRLILLCHVPQPLFLPYSLNMNLPAEDAIKLTSSVFQHSPQSIINERLHQCP